MIILYISLGVIAIIAITILMREFKIAEEPFFKQHFTNIQFSAREFFRIIRIVLYEKNIPNLKTYIVLQQEGGFFSASRESLRILNNNIAIDISAVYLGSGLYITCRKGARPNVGETLFNEKSTIYRLLEYLFYQKTNYSRDKEAMYFVLVQASINEAIKILTENRIDQSEYIEILN